MPAKNGFTKECLVCGKEFWATPSRDYSTCSRKCDGIRKQDRIKKICPVCSKEFSRCRSKDRITCSTKCSAKQRNHRFKIKPVSKTCPVCNEVFTTKYFLKQICCSKKCSGIFCAGRLRRNWKGGKSKTTKGYIKVYIADVKGYVFEHRLIMENHIGRKLRPEEVVHHNNENKADNRIENLTLFATTGEHTSYHKKLKYG